MQEAQGHINRNKEDRPEVCFGTIYRVEIYSDRVEKYKSKEPFFEREDAQQIFLVSKLFKLLFPSNSPRVGEVLGSKDRGFGISYERIIQANGDLCTLHQLHMKLNSGDLNDAEREKYECLDDKVRRNEKFRSLVQSLNDAGFYFEFTPTNFIVNEHGNYVFVDFDPAHISEYLEEDFALNNSFTINFEKIARYINLLQIDTVKREAENLLMELKTLVYE